MNRITKTLAAELSRILLKKNKEEMEAQEKSHANLVTMLHHNSIPKSIMAQFEKYPEYFDKTASKTFVDKAGVDKIFNQYGSKSLPDSNTRITLNNEDMTSLKKSLDLKENLKTDYGIAERKLSAALYALRTKARVIEEFPELEQHFPKTPGGALVNMSQIKSLIKK